MRQRAVKAAGDHTSVAKEYAVDVVAQFDRQELGNAINQAQREITTRYDFKDTGESIELGEDEITLQGPSDFKLKAMIDVLQSKFVKRNLSLKILKPGPIEHAAQGNVRPQHEPPEGTDADRARTLAATNTGGAPSGLPQTTSPQGTLHEMDP